MRFFPLIGILSFFSFLFFYSFLVGLKSRVALQFSYFLSVLCYDSQQFADQILFSFVD